MKGQQILGVNLEIMISIVFVILGSILMFVMFSLLLNLDNIHAAVAEANFDNLGSAINEVCALNRNHAETTIDFKLPERKPTVSLLGAQLAFLNAYRMKSQGDPIFLIYYEMFPPGEAIGWEVYQNFDTAGLRIISESEADPSRFPTIISETEKRIERENEVPEEVDIRPAIINVVLSEAIPEFFDPLGIYVKDKDFKNIGHWEEENEFFAFAGFDVMYKHDKRAALSLKYLSCGDNSLCMKSPWGVRKYHLDACEENGIDYIQFVYPANKNPRYRVREGDFYIASPCEAKLRIVVDKDEDHGCRTSPPGIEREVDIPGPFDLPIPLASVHTCDNAIVYPIFEYQGGNLVKVGEHYSCMDPIGSGTEDYLDGEGMNCVRVIYEEKSDFCYTYNTEKTWGDTIINGAWERFLELNPGTAPLEFLELANSIVPDLLDRVPKAGDYLSTGADIALFEAEVYTDVKNELRGQMWIDPVTKSTKFLDDKIYYIKNVPGPGKVNWEPIQRLFALIPGVENEDWFWP